MFTVALRFADNFAPACGTITAHQEIIDSRGRVLYGKLGSPISSATSEKILAAEEPKVLLVHSGHADRWWAIIDGISREPDDRTLIPDYYRHKADDFHSWLHVVELQKAPNDIMTRCTVISSGRPLSLASRHSMSPYFLIDFE